MKVLNDLHPILKMWWLSFDFVFAGYSCLSEPSVLHDTCNSRMFICLHAASVHTTQLHRLCNGTSHGQRHGKILTSHTKTYCHLSSPITSCFLLLFSQVKTGFVMNILGILSVSLAMNTWGVAMFDLNVYPEWAHSINTSAVVTDVHLSPVQSLNATLWSLTQRVSEDCVKICQSIDVFICVTKMSEASGSFRCYLSVMNLISLLLKCLFSLSSANISCWVGIVGMHGILQVLS